jgi:hypothetical protein
VSALAMFFWLPLARAQVTNTFQDGVNGYTNTSEVGISTQDAVDTGGNGSTEYHDAFSDGELLIISPYVVGDPQLDHDYETRVLLRFDSLNLPPGASVQSATLQMTFENYSTVPSLNGYYVLAPWSAASAGLQNGVGFVHRDTNADWAVPGAFGMGTDIVAGKSFTLTNFAGNGADVMTVALDPAVVQTWAVSAASDQGVLLVNENTNVYVRMFASWYTNNPAYRPKLTISYVPGVPPGIATAASATPNPVASGVSNNLSVLGSDSHGETNLTYTWSAASEPAVAASPTFLPNGNNAAKNSTAVYSAAGNYTLQVVAQNAVGLTATSSVAVVVNGVYSQVAVSPASAKVVTNTTRQFTAVEEDQFGNALASQQTIAWSVTGGGTIDATGLFSAGTTAGGPFQVRAQAGAITGTATVNVGLPNQLPTVNLTSPGAGQIFAQAAEVTVAALAGDSDGTVVSVEFFADGGLIGEADNEPYSVSVTNLAVGSHTLTAVATDNDGGSSTSAPVTIMVTAPVPPSQFTDGLTGSGGTTPTEFITPVVSDAQASPGALTPLFSVGVPNAQVPRLMNFVQPAIAIPYNSNIREIEAYWNGTPLPLIDPSGTGLAEEAHAYGSPIPFFKPMFSVAAIPAGSGTLEIRAFDGSHVPVTNISIPNLSVVKPPTPVAASTIAAMPHPRIYLSPARLATIQARPSTDFARQRYEAGLNFFLAGLQEFPDVLSVEFEDQVYNPEGYIPTLALAYQLHKVDDPAMAAMAAGAAHTLTTNMAMGYANGLRNFDGDDGYNIRYDLAEMMLAYDWMYDQFTPAERSLLVNVATNWLNWYNTPGFPDNVTNGSPGPGFDVSTPTDNYYSGNLQGLTLTALATAGDNPTDDYLLGILRAKLTNEVPVLNDRTAGGDWPEGGNYGPYTVLEESLVNTALREVGEDWGADFDWLQSLPRGMLYMTAPDYSQTRSYGAFTSDYDHKTSPSMLAVLSTTTTQGAFASLIYSNMNANPTQDFGAEQNHSSDAFYEMIFATNATPPALGALPLSYFNTGTGRFFSRSSLTDPQGYFVSTENMSYAGDHYGADDGDVRLYHGTNVLVAPAAYAAPDNFNDDGELGTPAFSTYLVNGLGQEPALSRNNQNTFLGDNGIYSAMVMRFESSWPTNRYDDGIVDPANPLDYLIREVVHLRPGTLIVRDLHRRRHDTDALSAQFHIGLTNAVQNTTYGNQIGALHISTLYPAGVNVSYGEDHDLGGDLIGTLMQLQFASSTAPMELVTVFSETVSGMSYTNGVLKLSDGTSVSFGSDGTPTVSGVAAPTLSVTRVGNSLNITWPVAFSGWQLQENLDLTPGQWVNVVGTIPNDGVVFRATVLITRGTSFFYRLVH